MLDIETLLIAAVNGARDGLTDKGWQELQTAMAFFLDRSTGAEAASFAVIDGDSTSSLREWVATRPKGTHAYLTEGAVHGSVDLPPHVAAGFRDGGLAGPAIVQEPGRSYGMPRKVTTRPEYQTTGGALWDYIRISPYQGSYVNAFLKEQGSAEALQKMLEAVAPERVSDVVREFRTYAKEIEGTGKDWSRFIGAIPYADRTQVGFAVLPLGSAPPAEVDLVQAKAKLVAALTAARRLTEGRSGADNWRGFFDDVLKAFDEPPHLAQWMERRSRKDKGVHQARSLPALLQQQGLSDDALRLLQAARSVEGIFGGMGSWNDTEYADAAETAALYSASHAAYRTAVNQLMCK